MIRISDFYSLVKTFFKNIFSFKLSFEQQFKLFITKAFEILFRVYVKKVDDSFFYSNERKDRFKSKGFIKRTVTTAFGYVTFERRKYVDKKTGVCYYIDEKIGLKRYRRLSEELIFTILLNISILRLHLLQRLTVFQKLPCIILSILLKCQNLILKGSKRMMIHQYIWKLMKTIWNVEEAEIHIWGWLLYIVELRSCARTGTSSLTSIQ